MIKSREIPKVLRDLAKKEFISKRPDRVEIRKAKNTQILRRGFGPQISVFSQEKSIPFLMILNYKTIFRVYHISADARIVGGQNFTKTEFEQIKKKINKYTDIIYKIVRPKPKEITIEDIKDQINQDFQKIAKKLGNEINIQFRKLPYLSINNKMCKNNLRFGVYSEKNNIITLSDEFIGKNLKIIFIRELFRLILPKFLDETSLNRLSLLGTYQFIKNSEKEWLENIWNSIEKIPFNLKNFNRENVLKLFDILIKFDKFNNIKFNEKENIKLIQLMSEKINLQNYNHIFSEVYFSLYNDVQFNDVNKKMNCLIYAICYLFLNNSYDLIPELINKLDNVQIRNLFQYLNTFNWIQSENAFRNLELNNKKFRNLVNNVMKHIRNNLIEVKMTLINKEVQIDTNFEIKIKIANKSKNSFNSLEIKGVYYKPKNIIKILDQEHLEIYKLEAGDIISIIYKFKALKSGKIMIKGITLVCKDENDYLHEFRSNDLIFQIKNKSEM
ncbi:MAG: hypothetical protein ACTSPY_05045 [Candidatus Helarchaeota archaeon]